MDSACWSCNLAHSVKTTEIKRLYTAHFASNSGCYVMLRCTARVLPVMGFIPMIGRAWKNPWGNVCTECRHSPVWPCLYTAQQTRSTRRSWHCLSTEGLKTDEDEDAGEEDFDFSSASNQLTVKAANREEKARTIPASTVLL